MNTFGDNLRKAMEKAEINATELSEKTGISKSTISRYLSGGYIAEYVAKRLGHSSLATTANIYYNVTKDDARQAADKMEDIL